MAVWFGVLIALGGVHLAHAASPEFQPNLLSYGEVTRLSPAVRAQYFADVADLLVEMEDKLVLKNEYAALESSRRLNAQVALLMQMAGGVPEAAADEDDVVDPTLATPDEAKSIAAIKPRWSGPGYTCGDDQIAQFDGSVATCVLSAHKGLGPGMSTTSTEWKGNCPFGSKRFVVKHLLGNTAKCVPQASFDALAPNAKERLMAGKFYKEDRYEKMTPEEKQALTGVKPVDEPVAQAAASGAAGAPTPGCEIKPKACPKMTKAQRAQALIDFRKNPEAKMCIAGGFFTKKDQARTSATCEVTKRFPATGDDALKCEGVNEVMCNPVVFCLQIEGVKYMSGKQAKTADLPVRVCVKNGPHITRACRAKLKAHTSGKEKISFDGIDKSMDDARTKTPKRCDPSKVNWPVAVPFVEEYKKLRAETEARYREFCLNEKAGMLQLFCKECSIVGESLRRTVAKAGKACGGAGTDAPAQPAAPGAQPAANPGGEPATSN